MLIVSHDTPNPKLSDFIDTYIDKSYDTCTCSEVSDKLIEFEYQLVIFDISQNSEEVLNAMNSSLSFGRIHLALFTARLVRSMTSYVLFVLGLLTLLYSRSTSILLCVLLVNTCNVFSILQSNF